MKSDDRITIEQERTNDMTRRDKLKEAMRAAQSIPDRLLASAERNALETRREIQKLKDMLRRHPSSRCVEGLLLLAENQLAIYQVDIAEMKEFHGK